MIFCGQCGLQLAPGNTVCPRCGMVTQPDLSMEESHIDDPTVASLSTIAPDPPQPNVQRPGGPFTPFPPPNQQKLVLRPGGASYEPSGQGAGDATHLMDAPTYEVRTPMTPSNPNIETPYPDVSSPGGIGYQPVPGQLDTSVFPQTPPRRGKGRVVALLIILLALLLILSAMVVFTLNLNGFLGNNPTPTPTAAQQAQAVITQYYNYINQKDYKDAYNLLGADFQRSQPYDQFVNGYANTQHDDIIFDQVTPLTDGTVKVVITINATETSSSGTVTRQYQGSDIVGQENGTWKILSGSFHPIGS